MMNNFGFSDFGSGWGMFAGFGFALPLLALAFLIFEIFMLVDAIKHQKETKLIVWVLIILMVNPIGSILYYFMEKQKREDKIS